VHFHQDPSNSTSSDPFPPKTPLLLLLLLLLPIDHIWSKISHPRLNLLLTHRSSFALILKSSSEKKLSELVFGLVSPWNFFNCFGLFWVSQIFY
ncbi:hypothetical protein PanWU01x14_157000, partial [Parasponia andersonii]